MSIQYSVLGFNIENVSNSGVGSTIISRTIAQISGPYYLYINSNSIGSVTNCNVSDGAKYSGRGPQICRIPISVNFGSVIFYKDPGN